MEEHSSLEQLAGQKRGVDELQTYMEVDDPKQGPQAKKAKTEREEDDQALVEEVIRNRSLENQQS